MLYLALKKRNPKLYKLIIQEEKRQNEILDMIASENHTPESVREIMASRLCDKYIEGWPGARYYPGAEYHDQGELWGEEEARKLFRLNKQWGVSLQSHSGSPANFAVYAGIIQNKDEVILGMRLDHGGHLTHGHKVSEVSRFFNFQQYGVKDNGWLDYEEMERLAKQFKPKLIIAGYSAYSRKLDYKRFRKICDEVRALLMVDMAHFAGLSAARAYPSPFPFADIVTTTTHKTLRGPRGAIVFSKGDDLTKQIRRKIFPGLQGGPHSNQTIAILEALCIAQTADFRAYGKQVVKNAKFLAKQLIKNKISILTGGTDNHLMIVDLRPLKKEGLTIETALYKSGIQVSRSAVPNDPLPPKVSSGIRIGTAALTARGMKENEMMRIADLISAVIYDDSEKNARRVKKETLKMARKHPLK